MPPETPEGLPASSQFSKIQAKCRSAIANDLFCIEVFAGSSRLTACIRRLGFRSSFGVDHAISAKCCAPVLTLDLQDEPSVNLLKQLLADPHCIYAHFAPPCGAASRARMIVRKGRYNPPVLRTDEYPNGLPNLSFQFRDRVAKANRLYATTADLCQWCVRHGVLFSIENPGRSFMWLTDAMQDFLANAPHFDTLFHHCQYGSNRRKLTRLVHNIPTFLQLENLCDGSHPHEPWGQTDNGWATAEETAYPWKLCQHISIKTALFLQDLGLPCQTPAHATQAAQLEALRAQTEVQLKAPVRPLVSEFADVVSWPANKPLPPLARAISTPPLGKIASEGNITIGIHRPPEQFVKDAAQLQFPGRDENVLPRLMTEAAAFTARHSAHYVAQHRSEQMRRLVNRAKQLQTDEDELKAGMSQRRKEVLKAKRIKLLSELINEVESQDVNLCHDIANGFDLVGQLPASNVFSKKMRPASLAPESLRELAPKARAAVMASVRSSGDFQLDKELYEVTLAERDKGFLEGPIKAEDIPFTGTVTRRFGVSQKGKLRPIDDYKASLVNSAVTQTEGVTIHGIDHIAALGACLMTELGKVGKYESLVSKCWDLSGAYKQLAISDAAFELDAFLAVWDPWTSSGSFFKQRVLPFGSIASVTAFLRCSLAIWMIGSGILKLCWTSYFDDYLHIEVPNLKEHSELCVQLLFDVLGWKVSSEKLLPYDTLCKVLGVQLDMTKSVDLILEISNTDARKLELIDTVNKILADGKLGRHECEKLRGRLQFASSQLFGRRFRNCLSFLNAHARDGKRTLDEQSQIALRMIVHLLTNQRPRGVTVHHSDTYHLYVDAAFEPGGHCGPGGVLYDMECKPAAFFSEKISDESLSKLMVPGQKTAIFELEFLAVYLGLVLMLPYFRGKRVVVFTDNSGVLGALQRCTSKNATANVVIQKLCQFEEDHGFLVWLERVPSQSNMSDCMSREVMDHFEGLDRLPCNLDAFIDVCLAEH